MDDPETAYRAALQKARTDLDDCTRQKEELESKIVRLRQAIDGLAALCEATNINVPAASLSLTAFVPAINVSVSDSVSVADLAGLGLSTFCQNALKAGGRFMTPVEVKEQVETMGTDLTKYNNALASIHGVLKRFAENGRALTDEVKGKTAYKWNPNFVGPRRRRYVTRGER